MYQCKDPDNVPRQMEIPFITKQRISWTDCLRTRSATKGFKKVLNWLDWFISNNSRQSYIVNAIRHPMFHTLLVEHSPFSVLCDNNLSTSLPIFTLQDNHLKVHPIKRYSLLTDILPVHKHDSR